MRRTHILVLLLAAFLFTGSCPAQDAWRAKVFGDDWQTEDALLKEKIPALKKNEGIKSTKEDAEFLKKMVADRRARIDAAITAYYVRMDGVTKGYAGRKFSITAAREVDGYVLLWIEEPQIDDGGRAVIYSTAKDRIVRDFWDGGIRG